MIIRNGNYTRLDGHDCALYEARQDAPIPFTHFIVRWYLNFSCPIEKFILNEHGDTIRIFQRNEIKNAFKVVTKALFHGIEMDAYNFFAKENAIGLTTYSFIENSNFVKSTDQYGIDYYIGMIDITEISSIWEERSKSEYDLPLPKGIEKKKMIYQNDIS